MNAKNPQAPFIDGAKVLVAFSGPDSYISPNWRSSSDRGATWDYTAVHVWGTCHARPERKFFKALIEDLAKSNERKVEKISDKPRWSLENVTTDYVDRLFPGLLSFEITIEEVKGISKLHQDFPDADALSVADHLEKIGADNTDRVAAQIRDRRS